MTHVCCNRNAVPAASAGAGKDSRDQVAAFRKQGRHIEEAHQRPGGQRPGHPVLWRLGAMPGRDAKSLPHLRRYKREPRHHREQRKESDVQRAGEAEVKSPEQHDGQHPERAGVTRHEGQEWTESLEHARCQRQRHEQVHVLPQPYTQRRDVQVSLQDEGPGFPALPERTVLLQPREPVDEADLQEHRGSGHRHETVGPRLGTALGAVQREARAEGQKQAPEQHQTERSSHRPCRRVAAGSVRWIRGTSTPGWRPAFASRAPRPIRSEPQARTTRLGVEDRCWPSSGQTTPRQGHLQLAEVPGARLRRPYRAPRD